MTFVLPLMSDNRRIYEARFTMHKWSALWHIIKDILKKKGGLLMRADRLLAILLALQVQRCITARELAQRLEVSERTIYRDMEALSMAGIPVFAERGAGGGWMLS